MKPLLRNARLLTIGFQPMIRTALRTVMIHSMIHSPCVLLILALLAVDVCAQAPAPPPKQATPVFRTLGLGTSFTDLFYMQEKKDVPVRVTEDARSEFYVLPSTSPVEFYRIEKGPDDSLKRIPVAKAVVPAPGKLPLFVFSAGPSGQIVIETLDDSLGAFPGGSYRILNRLDQALEAVVKKQKSAIPARGAAVIDARGSGTTVFVQLFTDAAPRPKLIFSNNWAFAEAVRTLVVVVPPTPPSKTPVVRRIPEPISSAQPPAPAPAPATAAAPNAP